MTPADISARLTRLEGRAEHLVNELKHLRKHAEEERGDCLSHGFKVGDRVIRDGRNDEPVTISGFMRSYFDSTDFPIYAYFAEGCGSWPVYRLRHYTEPKPAPPPCPLRVGQFVRKSTTPYLKVKNTRWDEKEGRWRFTDHMNIEHFVTDLDRTGWRED